MAKRRACWRMLWLHEKWEKLRIQNCGNINKAMIIMYICTNITADNSLHDHI